MKSALEGLKGVTKVEMDLKHDLFRATLAESDPPTKEDVFNAVKELGYIPSLVTGESFSPANAEPVTESKIPPLIQRALDQARVESKPFVIVKGTGDN